MDSSTRITSRDPICGMAGVLERHGQWFCSERCAEAFERRQKGDGSHFSATCKTREPSPISRRWWRDPWVWVPCSGALFVGLGLVWSTASVASAIYLEYVLHIGLPLALGLFLGGLVDYFVPKTYIVALLSGPRTRVIARATGLGFLASSCSHGCLALSLELYRKGASIPAVISFLLASPWASLSLTFILLSLFGIRGLVIVVASLLIAFVTGLVFQRLERRQLLDPNPNVVDIDGNFSLMADIRERLRAYRFTPQQAMADAGGVLRGTLNVGRMMIGWVHVGLLLSALMGAWLPKHAAIHHLLGPSLGGLLLTMAFAAIIEVCSEGTAPIAFELYRQTGALGNAFAFLMGGVVTDYTELGALWTTIGKRTALWMVAVTLPMVLVAGWMLNQLGR